MPRPLHLDPDRLLPADPRTCDIARALFREVAGLPIISPHGHTDAEWFATNAPFGNAAALLLVPDHYLFRGTPSRMWLDWVFAEAFGIDVRLDGKTADFIFDTITEALQRAEFRPRALFDRYGIELLATTESPLDDLEHHRAIHESGWQGRVIIADLPDPVVDPDFEGFVRNLATFFELTGEDCSSWQGYLAAYRKRRAFFAERGATSTDHGHPNAATANLTSAEAEALFDRVKLSGASSGDAELFRAQMLAQMAGMSLDDGLVMQIHPGSFRNYNQQLFEASGRDKSADNPTRTDYVHALRPLLERYGNGAHPSIILFTLDESSYARELALLAGPLPLYQAGPGVVVP